MTDLKFTSPSGETTLKVEDTGRLGTVAPKTQLHIKDEPVKYETPMTEIEDIEAQIKVLQSKLEFYKELEQTKTPCEEAYKNWWGEYPSNTWQCDVTRWEAFKMGYNAAYEEKVAEEPIPEEKELKTLYDILRELDKPMLIDDVCSAVKRWIFQYDCDYVTCKEHLEGYEECQTVLEERIK